ncbi:hypothetical protein BN1708_014573 [Verticillium longisporum]|uniref:C2H2-type domain-containing protein n=1 Tax=Verticillium longisporum TaxID=100787 RepID=A0A0G4LX81_VERLO|nr:hypothetical protein BN1708_014573 [Verticillium longisporum]
MPGDMSANPWPGDGSSQPPPAPHQEDLDRQLIQHLLGRYGHRELSRLIRDEVGPQSDGASIISSAPSVAPSSVLSDDASSVWDTQSVRTFSSDTSSIAGSIRSNVSKGAKFFARRTASNTTSATAAAQAQAHSQTVTQAEQDHHDAMQQWNSDGSTPQATPANEGIPTTSTSTSSKQKGAFMCGFCKEEDITKTCTRKNDLKRHIEDFHNVNAQWFCRHRGCQMVFDWQAAYKTHLKTAHGGSRMSLDEAKVNLCQQVVFACGFENCPQVYEAPNDDDAAAVFKDYVSHVVKHFDEGSNSGEWTYSARIRNLLRQAQVAPMWNESAAWNEGAQSKLVWNPQTSGILRKRLESRHIGDIKLLIQYAYILGTDPSTHRKFRDDFVTPVSDTCQQNIPGHKLKSRQPSIPAVPQEDPFSFRISRGTNPALAHYIASQRKVYVPSRQRSMRPPQLHQTRPTTMSSQHHLPQQQQQQQQQQRSSSQLGHFFSSIPETSQSPMYHDNRQYVQPNGALQNGIIADDLQSLRSITGRTPEPATDIEMQDGIMDFAGQYPLQSPAGDGPQAGYY